MEVPETTLADLVASYGAIRPREVATLRTVIRTIVLPYLGTRGEMVNLLGTVPASRLYATLATDGASWVQPLAASLPASTTYRKAYFRAVKRLVAHGEATGLLHPDQFFIAPAWRRLLDHLAKLTDTEPLARRSAIRGAFKRLARWATAHGIEPGDMPLEGPRPVHGFFESLPDGRRGDYYRARKAWNMLAATGTVGLAHWGAVDRGRRAGCPRQTWPEILNRAIEGLIRRDGLAMWRETTCRGYLDRLGGYLAVLGELGVDVDDLMIATTEPVDALRLLFQGLPAGSPKLDARSFATRLVADTAWRAELTTRMAELGGCYDGRASEANPFLGETIALLVDAGTIATAIDLTNKALTINRGLLGLTERHTHWLAERRQKLRKLAAKQPTAYAFKKRAVFRQPRLWEDLVRVRPRLRDNTIALERAWREARGARAVQLQCRWAVAMRNEVLLGLLLCYPLRAANVLGMKLGSNYRLDTHALAFEAAETKNERAIEFELPAAGALADVRELMTTYITEARPVLLAGRSSEFVFVPDSRGGCQLREKGLNAILEDMSRRFFPDVLPPGMTVLNPHLLRHAAASYALAVRKDLNLAAQLLNDAPSTVAAAYADILASGKEATKAFLDDVSI